MLLKENSHGDQFPVGMRVLAIDANFVCLKYLVTILQQCRYKVTATTDAEEALQILRNKDEEFDIVITDVVREDIDGFKLLQIISLEMDIPVVMVSANDDVSNIMRSIKHGARDYLLKPVRLQEMMNIWQHVIRKNLDNPEKSSITKEIIDQKTSTLKRTRNQSTKEEDESTKEDGETNTYPDIASSSQKKSRMTWTQELHEKFLDAIQELGNEEAVPNTILKIMNVPGLTRENVASHLQKFRNILKKQKANQQKNGEPNLNRNSTNMHGCHTAYQSTIAVPSNIYPVNLVPNSEELASSKQPYQYYMQSRQYPMEQGMHNHVYGNPPSTPLPTENYLPVPDFKLLKFPSVFPGIKVVDGCLGISSGPSNTPPFSPSIPDVCYIPSTQMVGDNDSTQIDSISQHGLVAWPPQDFGPEQHAVKNFVNEPGDSNCERKNIDLPDYMQDPNLTDLKGKGKAKAVQYFPEHPHMESGFHQYRNSFTDDELTIMVKEFNDDDPPKL